MIAVCGDAREPVSMCPGRTGPELGSQLFQLERFCDVCPDFVSGYMQGFKQPFVADPGLLSVHEHPELMPYRSLDVSRLRLVCEGKWPMESFLNGPLWLPFQEPAFLCHDMEVPVGAVPNFAAEKPAECLKLARLWDVRGLLHLEAQPLKPGYFSRVFNAYKDQTRDRQIGDRRLPNLSEFHVDGPSKFLPQGRSLVYLRLPRFTHCIRGSITDRRDFYHQAAVTEERARTNMLPFAFRLKTSKRALRLWTSRRVLCQSLLSGERSLEIVCACLPDQRLHVLCLRLFILVLDPCFGVITWGSSLL